MENAELLASLGRITRPGGDPFPTGQTDLVRVLAVSNSAGRPTVRPTGTADDDGAAGEEVLPARLLYCPSQLVLRAGLAANALMEGIHGPLAQLLIPEEQRDRHQERIDLVKAREGIGRVHTRASTWGIPFSWFCLFQESDPTDVVESGGRIITVRIRATIGTALERVRHAVTHLAARGPRTGHARGPDPAHRVAGTLPP